MYSKRIKWCILGEMLLLCSLFFIRMHLLSSNYESDESANDEAVEVAVAGNQEYIKWVDFTITLEALNKAYKMDVETFGTKTHLSWIDLLAYVAAKNGGKFGKSSINELEKVGKRLLEGETTLADLTSDLKYYAYYKEAYEAVLGGYVGEYERECVSEDGTVKMEPCYGLKVFSPIAKGFPFSHYDDFGSSRSYGYKRVHLGHDMMGQIGTPIIAVESGYVEAIGWNQYGGWRLGIRSMDKKRYYYYAHLRQNYPYQSILKEGSIVTAGDVIGYMGHTGYSTKENVNNIEAVHLHFGVQLIFDESQKEGNNEIWIDCYDLTRFLEKNKSEVKKVEGTKEWESVYNIKIPDIDNN
ncbi:MAG: peptidoglycan LD-endopeptidase LytH [Clostridiales bacterium]|nr:peptidoglycan LD-endopeptidase LytH [Clostridiales bacterium]